MSNPYVEKAAQKLSVLYRINKYLSYDQMLLPVNSLVKYQFVYCPMIWMFCPRTLSNSLNHIHKRAIRLVHDNYNSSFYDILEMPNKKTIHQKNLELLTKEASKCFDGLSPRTIPESIGNALSLNTFKEKNQKLEC